MNITEQIRPKLERIRADIAAAAQRSGRDASAIRLVAVTKKHPIETINALFDLGISDIGENRVQELMQKQPLLAHPFTVHLIGHLQRNKAGKALQLAHTIQSVDSQRLLETLKELAQKAPDRPEIYIEVNTSGDENKTGCPYQEAPALIEAALNSAPLALRGLMTMGPLAGTQQQVRGAFQQLRLLAEQYRPPQGALELSMGMSNDYVWAIEEGATLVRIGTALLGSPVSAAAPSSSSVME